MTRVEEFPDFSPWQLGEMGWRGSGHRRGEREGGADPVSERYPGTLRRASCNTGHGLGAPERIQARHKAKHGQHAGACGSHKSGSGDPGEHAEQGEHQEQEVRREKMKKEENG